jgi:hypothetical protein
MSNQPPRVSRRSFDPPYFDDAPWSERVQAWIALVKATFSDGNLRVVTAAIGDHDSGLRAVVNIGVTALLSMVTNGRYLNLYERPVIGGQPRKPSLERREVDRAMGIQGGNTYFAAVALGGAGVRYYGEYCMVLDLSGIDTDPSLFDRDSYDILVSPIAEADRDNLVRQLKGSWANDVRDMVLMKVLPEVIHDRQLVTTGTVSDLILKDQEFIEVHLRPGQDRSFGASEVEELRESPDEVAVATRLAEREAAGERLSEVDYRWLTDREIVARAVRQAGIRSRVVTQHGRGYQWK